METKLAAKPKKRLLMILVPIAACICLIAAGLGCYSMFFTPSMGGDSSVGIKIDFGGTAGGVSLGNMEISADIKKLQMKANIFLSINDLYVYFDPEEDMQTAVEAFGMADAEWTDKGETRTYRKNNELLMVDKYGCFSYKKNTDRPYDEFRCTERETYKIAKKFLE
ncbi:MAG: hypothetical protein KBT31_00420, partial [Firmicutes bacterium]|nr:hypothetical protein [Candidatus Colimorpha enterica]